ncbi:phosphotriesterase family protein [Amycolatopsis pithecellobii]|uniref:Phosphotriesterase-related protein n=1 Tax=Amycolatopsis pithecellobii TaxID=664692 RepID=A0A6N7YVE3_9PSEU|nr:phosphotriesterase-related protein [Amycolatopsis pithecellobii]MTD57035.1 phosphotriesterase-related protein [Amycolatopsis pithecellobii]
MHADLAGKVMTVLGPVEAGELGVTLPHEHVIKDSADRFPPPAEAGERAAFEQPLNLENLHRVTYGRFGAVRDNTRLVDEDCAIDELWRFRDAGGGAVVDQTSAGMNGDPAALARISAAAGVHIIAGCGYYLGRFHPPRVAALSEKDLTAELVRDLTEGIGGTGVRAGVIGEIGCSWPWHPGEEKVVRAAVAAQRESGVGLSVHPSPNPGSPARILRLLESLHAPLERIVICHMDRVGYPLPTRLDLLRSGLFIEYDTFGYHVHPILAATREGALPSMLNDVARVQQIVELVELGYERQILVSHDTAFKHALTKWGGQGYAHLPANVTPYFETYGLTGEHIEQLMVHNPRRLLEIS